jgi:dihydrofolate reductase
MRKIIVTQFITLDGVVQAPGGPKEDTSNGFQYGGWSANYQDEVGGKIMDGFMKLPFELLLGRFTYEIFSAYWPKVKSGLIAEKFNGTKKYVVSHDAFEPEWNNSTCVTGDVVAEIKKLKKKKGPDLWVHGSGNLVQTLFKNHLIDQMHLWFVPVTVAASGKRFFADGTQAEGFKLVKSRITSTGVIVATYEPAGKLKTGTIK